VQDPPAQWKLVSECAEKIDTHLKSMNPVSSVAELFPVRVWPRLLTSLDYSRVGPLPVGSFGVVGGCSWLLLAFQVSSCGPEKPKRPLLRGDVIKPVPVCRLYSLSCTV
jgi:hypothetical protein